MFLSNLTIAQQGVFLSLVRAVIHADAKIVSEEVMIMEKFKNEADSKAIETGVENSQLCAIFNTKLSRNSVLAELLAVAHIDSDFHIDEKNLVVYISNEFKISSTDLEEINEWVQRQIGIISEGIKLIENKSI